MPVYGVAVIADDAFAVACEQEVVSVAEADMVGIAAFVGRIGEDKESLEHNQEGHRRQACQGVCLA